MTIDDRQLTTRLRSAYTVDMGDVAQREQIATLATALAALPPEPPAAPALLERWRTKLVALIAAVSLASPVAVAVAAEGTVPGDVLYPVKQVTEDVRSVFDPTIDARHRIQEAEQMHESGHPLATVEVALTDADKAIEDIGNPVELRSQLDEMWDRIMMPDDHQSAVYTTGNDSPGDEYDLEDDIVKPQGEMHNDPQRQTERDRMGEPGQGGFSAEDGSDSEMGTWQESTPTTVAPTVAPTPTQEDRPSGTDWDQDSHTGSSTESDNMSPESGHDATTDQSSDWTRDETDHNWGN